MPVRHKGKCMKRNKCYKVSNEEFIEAVKTSYSIRETLTKLNMNAVGAAYRSFRLRIIDLGISIDHFTGKGHLKGKNHNWGRKIPLCEILVENSIYTSHLKDKIIKAELLEYKCNECGIYEWNGKKLILQLDHINGINTDNRIENLRLLCPNCHSMTPTFCSRNANRQKLKHPKHESFKLMKFCAECNTQLKHHAHTVCGKCYNLYRKKYQKKSHFKTKIEWPSDEELLSMLEVSNFTQLAKKLGVSDNAIRKRLKNRKQ